MNFEWDKSKAEDNFRKHGIRFEFAQRVFDDVFAVEFLDDREDYGETRFVIIGAVEGCFLYVAYTEREEREEDVIRIISARRATANEQEIYFEEES
ncbi:MAG TPA: BrnT family toxin [Candidatus Acidoferrum sp.]|nr:BrnT family toxin [Candidatus Acidoferrum sp.]